MKVAIFLPKNEFTEKQQKQLFELGEIVYSDSRREYSVNELLNHAKGADIIVPDPDNFGGFEKAREKLTKVMESLPKLKGVALSTTSYGWINLNYCKTINVPVCNIPGYSRESVAEHALALLLCLSKLIIKLDRKMQKGEYKIEMGKELKGKTLGIIGIGNIGSRIAELGRGIGMKVIAYNRSPKKYEGVEIKSLDEVLRKSDAISLNVTHSDENKNLIGRKEIEKMKDGVIIVNTVDRDIIEENAMMDAIKSGKVFGYAYEGEDFENTPLVGLDNAIGLKGFGWYTKESLSNLFQILTDNIVSLANKKPKNMVNRL